MNSGERRASDIARAGTAGPVSAPPWMKLYVWLLMILLPMDWFAPTGALLRELGGKPAILLMLAGGVLGLLMRSRVPTVSGELSATTAIVAFLALGFSASLLNFVLGWSGWYHSRDPFVQLASQALMLFTAGIALIGNSRLMRIYPVAQLAAKYLPLAALVQFGVFSLEFLSIIDDASGPLLLFRAADQGIMERPSGLFSEPSYFGTFAALYGSALLVLPGTAIKRGVYRLLALMLYASAVLIGAKTFVVVAGAQAMFFVLRHTRTVKTKLFAVLVVLIVGVCGVFFIQTYRALNVEQNLSSAIRFGSAVVAANAALDGYGLTGIGIGQFHFFFRNEFAPSFIYASWEGILQLSPDADNRASTYNFYIRVLLEMGLAGFILLAALLRKLWMADIPDSMKYVQFIFAGALGFLLTQDTYFYPPLVFSAAMIMAYGLSTRLPNREYAVLPADLHRALT